MPPLSSNNSPADTRLETVRNTAHAFCQAFTSGASPDDILKTLFTSSEPKITEHGSLQARSRLPYVGLTFHGRKTGETQAVTCDDYFALLGATLAFHSLDTALPPPEAYIVDPESRHLAGLLVAGDMKAKAKDGHGDGDGDGDGRGAVLVKAHATVEALKTGVTWDENFVFLMSDFDSDGKIGHLEIWSDNLSAWLAVGE